MKATVVARRRAACATAMLPQEVVLQSVSFPLIARRRRDRHLVRVVVFHAVSPQGGGDGVGIVPRRGVRVQRPIQVVEQASSEASRLTNIHQRVVSSGSDAINARALR
jgi:hypothetical protein